MSDVNAVPRTDGQRTTPFGVPPDYDERVYAGVLGKLIGVYLGRPFEGWSYERIEAELGEIRGYVHDRLGLPLVVTDDDVSGTFTFLRSLEDSGVDPELTAEAIGRAWLNYLIEGRTVLWWGGLGHSTEHTAWLRLQSGIPAPRSGSVESNGPVVAEQIGAQIFIDGWAMVCPGDPERAASLARRAASVSHDGAAVEAAVLLAAMEAEAFVDPRIEHLHEVGLGLIPPDSIIQTLIDDLRAWQAEGLGWRAARARLAERYGSDRFPGNVHVVPNHGLIQLGLLWGGDDFSQSMTIVNTSGWDTDCNSGNLGCLQGIRLGLRAFEGGFDWRGPVEDRLYLPTAEGGRAITDAVIETDRVVAMGRRLAGAALTQPKDGARFHFSFPGAVQGFRAIGSSPSGGSVRNVAVGSDRRLRIERAAGDESVVAVTPTFITPDDKDMPGYPLLASPSLHPGQVVRATVFGVDDQTGSASARLVAACFDGQDQMRWMSGEPSEVAPGSAVELTWRVPDTGGQPISQVGIELLPGGAGAVDLDRLSWSGTPSVTLQRPADGGTLWRRAWVNGVDTWEAFWSEAFRLSQNRGTGLIMQGSLEWTDYEVEAVVTPHMATSVGLAARVGGMRRFIALLLSEPSVVHLVRSDDLGRVTLAVGETPWNPYRPCRLRLEVLGDRIRGWADGHLVADIRDTSPRARRSGGVGLLCEDGTLVLDEVVVRPVGSEADGRGAEGLGVEGRGA